MSPIIYGGSSSGGGSQTVREHKVTLQSADILALGTTPFTLVPAALGQIIVPLDILGRLHFGATGYAEAGVPRFFLSATDFASSGWGSPLSGSSIITALASTATYYTAGQQFNNFTADVNETLASLTSVPLRIDENGAVTLGDGTVDFTTLYYLLTP